jgi:hypothetical protein
MAALRVSTAYQKTQRIADKKPKDKKPKDKKPEGGDTDEDPMLTEYPQARDEARIARREFLKLAREELQIDKRPLEEGEAGSSGAR